PNAQTRGVVEVRAIRPVADREAHDVAGLEVECAREDGARLSALAGMKFSIPAVALDRRVEHRRGVHEHVDVGRREPGVDAPEARLHAMAAAPRYDEAHDAVLAVVARLERHLARAERPAPSRIDA